MKRESMEAVAIQALREWWGYDVLSLSLIIEKQGRRCYQADTDRGHLFVKVVKRHGENLDDISRGLRVQAYARRQGLPTNESLPTLDGKLCAELEHHGVFVERRIERQGCERSLARWEQFGRVAGGLHALPIPDELRDCLSRMEPRRSLDRIRTGLRQFNGHVPHEHEAAFESLCAAAQELDDFPLAPRSLIHSDLAWGNVVARSDERCLLVDFEGAGIGPPVIDLVEVTTYLCQGPSSFGPLMEDAARAFYRGHSANRRLSPEEAELFPRAHFFHQLYYLENSLGRGDYDFVRRMSARLKNWNGGVIDKLLEIASEST
jgi:Ser/Thr protein kinase RdoA (MazF antagonist)